MARVFVSHASQDRSLAGDVFGWLVQDGHELFYDQDLRAGLAVGDIWEQRLFERLRWADAVVCLVTSAYTASVWCSAEVGIAISRGSRMLPVIAEPTGRHPLLAGFQQANWSDPQSARSELSEALRRVDAAGGRGWVDGRSPFPGLRSFDTSMQRVFFGRGAEVQKLAQQLRSPIESADRGVLIVTGPSGCGKSSLARAGLLPVMAEEPGWCTLAAMLPGPDPVTALARELTRTGRNLGRRWEMSSVLARLANEGPAGITDDLLLAVPGSRDRRMLIVIDQLEELLTLTPDGLRARFVGILSAAIDQGTKVVATLRPEFLAPLLTNPTMAGLRPRSFLVRPLAQEAIREVIRGPAEVAGISVDPDLATRLVADTGSGGALPLLAFMLQQLTADLGRGGAMSLERYEQLGGVQGALTRQAEAALTDAVAAGGRSHQHIIGSLLLLVTVDEQGRPTGTRLEIDGLLPVQRAELSAFIGRRLLTIDTENGVSVVGVAHEAFLNSWLPLRNAVAGAAVALRTRRSVEQAAMEWESAGRSRQRLWERGQLAAAVNDLGVGTRRKTYALVTVMATGRRPRSRWRESLVTTVPLSQRSTDFLASSIRTDRRRRARATTILSVLLVLALAGGSYAYVQQREADTQTRVATGLQLLAQADALRVSDPRTSLLVGEAAYRINPGPPAGASLIQTITNTLYRARLAGHSNRVNSIAYSADGHLLAAGSADMTVSLWNVADPAEPRQIGRPLGGHTSWVSSVALSRDGHTLAAGSADRTVILWDIADPKAPHRLPIAVHSTGIVESVAFAPDGHTLVVGDYNNSATLWDTTDPANPHPLGLPLQGHRNSTNAISPDGHTLATGSTDSTVILWDVSDPSSAQPIGTIITHAGAVRAVAFSPNGRTLAVGSLDFTASLWDVSDLANPRALGLPLSGHTNSVNSVAFSPDGHTLATGGIDFTAVLWDVTDPIKPRRLGRALTGHTGGVASVAFAPDGRTLATGSNDSTVILWDLTGSTRPGHLPNPLTDPTDPSAGFTAIAFPRSGRTLATASTHGKIRLWDVGDPAKPEPLGLPKVAHSRGVTALAFTPDGRTLASASSDGTVQLWNVADPVNPTRMGQPLTGHRGAVQALSFAPDGRTLADGNRDSTVILWDMVNPSHPQLGPPLYSNTGPVTSVAFSPDGHTLAAGGLNYTIMVWDVSNIAEPRLPGTRLTGHTSAVTAVAFAPNGSTLASASSDLTAILWNSANLRAGAKTLTGHTDAVSSLGFAPDGRLLATGSSDATVILWDVADPDKPVPLGQPLTGQTGPINSVEFSPDGRTLAVGSLDSVQMWDLRPLDAGLADPLGRACQMTHGGLTPAEWERIMPTLAYQDACAP